MSADPYRVVLAATDPDWYRFLRARPQIEELNFWRPGGSATSMDRGTPWLFAIRGTTQIWGCAFFSAFSLMPVGVAWDTFGIANGFQTFVEFRSKISALQKGHARGTIGCVVLSNPQYFDRPIEYAEYGRMYGPVKYYDARTNEGEQLWKSVTAHLPKAAAFSPILHGGFGKPTLVIPRLGQAAFRIGLEREYQTRCAVTGERTRPALDAAHIKPYSLVGEHALQNGLLLRSDIHKLFDQGYVTITPDQRFHVSQAIRQEFENGRDYYALENRQISDTLSADARPSAEYLDWHSATVFKG